MKGTRRYNAQNKNLPAEDVSEEALQIAIKNVDLNANTIKALRLTCKRTKVAVDAKVEQFKMDNNQEPEAVQRSGLLKNIKNLRIEFQLKPSGEQEQDYARNLSRCLGLLTLAVDVCKSVEVLIIAIAGSSDTILSCAVIMGNSDWECVEKLSISSPTYFQISGFLSGLLANSPGAHLPALKILECSQPTAADLELLSKSTFVGNLTDLSIRWHSHGANDAASFVLNTAPATVTAMRNLLQNATNLRKFCLRSCTFDFFDSENLISLRNLELKIGDEGVGPVNLAPVLARPWPKLQTLDIWNDSSDTILLGSDLVRIFEAEDTLPVLKKLEIGSCEIILEDTLSCVQRPHLEEFRLIDCSDAGELLSKLARLMKTGAGDLPSLRDFHIICYVHHSMNNSASNRAAISEFLSCPCMAGLEKLGILNANIGTKQIGMLPDIANYCPKLKHLNLLDNNLGRPAVALLLGYGKYMGAWPELEELLLFDAEYESDEDDPNNIFSDHPYMEKLSDVEETMKRVWPKLKLLSIYDSMN